MRFYKNKQAEMLKLTSMLLKNEQNTLSARVPALKEFISSFLEKEKKLEKLQSWNPNAILIETVSKKSAKHAFAESTMKLLAVVKAANYKKKVRQSGEIHYTLWGLKKLSAADLCKVYLAAETRMKRIKNPAYYGLSPADMRDARAYYKEFAVIKNAPSKRRRDVAEKNRQLNDGIAECIDMLEHTIDPLMIMATENDHELKDKYKACRKVLARIPGRPSDAESAYRKSRLPKPNKVKPQMV